MSDSTNYGLPPLEIRGKKISVMRIVRTLVGLAIMVQAVFWPQPSTATIVVKMLAGVLLTDLTLFMAAKDAILKGKQ